MRRGRRKRWEVLRESLKTDRSSYIPHWQDLSDYILPKRSRFLTSEINDGSKAYAKIIDGTGTQAANILGAGMMGLITSPNRPWFEHGIPGLEIVEGEVKAWLHEVTRRTQEVFRLSNLYNALRMLYVDLDTFGTGAMIVEEDFDTVMRFYPQPIGSYMVAVDHRGIVNTFMREMQMTVNQIVTKWGIVREGRIVNREQFSNFTLRQFEEESGNTESYVEMVHVIAPNEMYVPGSQDTRKRKYVSAYYELGAVDMVNGTMGGDFDQDKIVSERGYDFFPALVARWSRQAGDAYGTNCPGMTALGDVKQLQKGESKTLKAIDKKVDPPMVGPASLRQTGIRIRPGDANYADDRGAQQGGLRAAHNTDYSVREVEEKNEQVRNRIKDVFFVNLVLMMLSSDRREITAREVEERSSEKLLVFGPVLEGLNQDLLDPLIDLAFAFMLRQGLVPEPPEELQGSAMRVEYISVMAQAQKAIALGGIERFATFVGGMSQFVPEALDKVNVDQVIDHYAEMSSVPPDVVVSDEVVAEKRRQREEQLERERQMAQAEQAAKAAKDLSGAEVGGNNALTALAGGLEG